MVFDKPMHSRRVVRATALFVFAVAFGLYRLTLFPGLGGGGDSAKFQYLGGVLGTAHPPGYPLYILVSHLFSKLPFGSPAFRINLMSASFGAMAVAVMAVTLLRLRCHVVVAIAAALSLAFDRFLWGKSLSAEVYSLNAALVALIVWSAVRWAENGRDRQLYVTAALLGLSLGNHLTAAMVAPALVVFVLVTRPASVRIRTAAVCVGLGLLGLLQYVFILIRSLQGAPFVEARATNLSELVQVIFASRYSNDMFQFTWTALITERVPRLWHLFVIDLGSAGLALAVIGLFYAWRNRLTSAWLFLVTLVAVAGLTVNIDADVDGFLIPAFVMAWLLAGLGMQGVWETVGVRGPAAAVAVSACLFMLPSWQLARHYKVNDHHRRTYEIRYYQALFDQFENRVAVVREEYAQDQLLLYKLAGEGAARGRDIRLVDGNAQAVRRLARDGVAIYAFQAGHRTLEGLGFQFEPVVLHEAGANGAPIDMSPMPLFRLANWTDCVPVGNLGWQDVTSATADARLTLRVDNYRAFTSEAVFYVAGASDRPVTYVSSHGPAIPALGVDRFRVAVSADRLRLEEQLQRDDVPDAARLLAQPVVQRVVVRVNDDGEFSQTMLGLAMPAPAVSLARVTVDLDNARRATVCGWAGRTWFASGSTEDVPMGTSGEMYFGRGWGPPASDAGGDLRWLSDTSADLVAPLERPAALRVRVRARPSDGPAVRAIGLSVNGQPLQTFPIASEWTVYEWDVEAGLVASSLNQIRLDIIGPSGVREPVRPAAFGASIAVGGLSIEQRPAGATVSAPPADR